MKVKIETSKATPLQLDWLVTKCEVTARGVHPGYLDIATFTINHDGDFCYSTDWAQGGPIIEREGINTFKYNKLNTSEFDTWGAHKVIPRKAMDGDEYSAALCLDGPTPLIAAMRCYVASRLGDEVDVPEELS